MAIQVNVGGINDVPEIMREFVTENNGVFTYDEEKAFQALKTERESAKNARNELSPWKALGLTADQVKAFQDLGKTPEELASIIAKAEAPTPKPNVKNSTEYLELEQRFKKLEGMQQEWEQTKAENLKNKRNGLVRKLIGEMPDEYDKELFSSFVESSMMEKFSLNDTQDGLQPVENQLPAEFLKTFADKFHFKKANVPGKAPSGNANIPSGANAAFEAALKNKNAAGLIANAPAAE